MFLLDTVVLSELRKRDRNPGLAEWVSRQSGADLFLSVISIGEIERGICSVAEKDPEFAERLTVWRDKLLMVYADRLLPVSVMVARQWGRLSVKAGNAGADILIAATAREHGLTVITRNTLHFSLIGVAVHNPWV
jgi:predicted nucleic acid-binding protein